MLKAQQDFVFSSNPANGAVNVTSKGDRFEIIMNPPLLIPLDAENVQVSVPQATVWYNTPNMFAASNSFALQCYHPNHNNPSFLLQLLIVMPPGMYAGIDQVNDTFRQELETATQALSFTDATYSWEGFELPVSFAIDPITGKTLVQFRENPIPNPAGPASSVNFAVENSIAPFLGFESGATLTSINLVNSANNVLEFLAPNAAKINSVNSYFIHTDLVTTGISVNGSAKQVVSQIPILVSGLGQQIKYLPPVPSVSQAPFLAGNTKTSILCWLTNEANEPVDTQGEYWDFRLRITYWYASQKPNVTTL